MDARPLLLSVFDGVLDGLRGVLCGLLGLAGGVFRRSSGVLCGLLSRIDGVLAGALGVLDHLLGGLFGVRHVVSTAAAGRQRGSDNRGCHPLTHQHAAPLRSVMGCLIPMHAPLYRRDGDVFIATEYTAGPWSAAHQHAGPPSALLANAAEKVAGIQPGQIVRLAYDILGPVPVGPLTVRAEVKRPGRSVELIESVLEHEGRPVMRAGVWRIRDSQPVQAETPEPPGSPEVGRLGDRGWWPRPEDGYVDALDWRFIEGDFAEPGPATVWSRVHGDLIEGEPIAPLERLLVMADAASGISAVLDWSKWLFINVDLGIHLERPPEGEWMAMAAHTQLGTRGAALCTSQLYDRTGRVGVSTQSLMVAPRG